MDRFERVKEKLAELRNLDKGLDVFGSREHKYLVNPVLAESEILSFEEKHDLLIPEGYRLFLKEIGNGGAGPFYGLLPLEDQEGHTVDLDSDFPCTADAPILLSKYKEYDEKIENAETDEEEQALWNLKDTLINQEFINATKGIIFLCHEGCGMCCVLVLRGMAKGTVWWFNFCDYVGVVPILIDQKPICFLDWYELWLDNRLAHMKEGKPTFSSYRDFV